MTMSYVEKAEAYLKTFCSVKPDRSLGSPGNRKATNFFANTISRFGYDVDMTPFPCIDYDSGDASLTVGGRSYTVRSSPFSHGCNVTAEVVITSTVGDLKKCACKGKLLLLKGELCAEPLMPKNFKFYNPDSHRAIYALLEQKQPAAIITATGKNPWAAGAVSPFPLITDGDFDIPSVYCDEATGNEIAAIAGAVFSLKSTARRIPSEACNVIARKNSHAGRKIIVCAHIDAKKGTPGALDNASGTVVLLLLAELLQAYQGRPGLEIVAFNGEDHYSAGGELDYLQRYTETLDDTVVAINVDSAGYTGHGIAYSFYGCPHEVRRAIKGSLGSSKSFVEGEQWFQGDHSIFIQRGVPAIALISENSTELVTYVTHTPADTPDLIDFRQLVETAETLARFLTSNSEIASGT
ncbi:MAG TPA: M28 family peptidase [Methanocella sp.]|nr:M28 family peptidase [Methanocella sp.]